MYKMTSEQVEKLELVCDSADLDECDGDILWPGPGTNCVWCEKHNPFQEWTEQQ